MSSNPTVSSVPYKEAIKYLNKKVGKHFKHNITETKDFIKARQNQDFRLEDFKKATDIKAAKWLNTDSDKYPRSETLFGSKFEGYLNQKIQPTGTDQLEHTRYDKSYWGQEDIMKPLFSEKISESLKKYQPTHVEKRLKCERYGSGYDLYKFAPTKKHPSGYEHKDGYKCEIYEEYKQNKQRKISSMFNQPNVSPSLRDATVSNHKPQNEKQVKAKQTAVEYVQSFSMKKPKSLILQGSYGIGKNHLAYAIAKVVKSKGHTVAFMHVPILMDRIKATYNRNAVETIGDLVRLLSDIDLLVLDNMGVENTEHTLSKFFSIADNGVDKNNIFTTNFSNKELDQNVNQQRISSRVKHSARKVRVIGDDFRERDIR